MHPRPPAPARACVYSIKVFVCRARGVRTRKLPPCLSARVPANTMHDAHACMLGCTHAMEHNARVQWSVHASGARGQVSSTVSSTVRVEWRQRGTPTTAAPEQNARAPHTGRSRPHNLCMFINNTRARTHAHPPSTRSVPGTGRPGAHRTRGAAGAGPRASLGLSGPPASAQPCQSQVAKTFKKEVAVRAIGSAGRRAAMQATHELCKTVGGRAVAGGVNRWEACCSGLPRAAFVSCCPVRVALHRPDNS